MRQSSLVRSEILTAGHALLHIQLYTGIVEMYEAISLALLRTGAHTNILQDV